MVNTNVYGAKNSWLTLTTGSSIKFANFGDNTGTFAKGYSTEKLKLNKGYDTSIVHSALGIESAISRIRTFKGKDEISSDEFSQTLWSFCVGDRAMTYVDSTSSDNTTFMIAPKTNAYMQTSTNIPVVNFAYNKLRAYITVRASDTTSYGGSEVYGLHDYCTNYKTSKPYILAVYLNLYEKIGDTWTAFNVSGMKGILIHNPTTYFKATHSIGKSYEIGILGNMIGTQYGSSANINSFIILGLLNQRLADNRLWKTDVNIISGDFECDTDSDGRGIFYMNYFDGFEEYAMHQTACFGIQFVTESQYINVDIDSPGITDEELNNVYIGVLDESYVGHGDFVNGEKIFDTEQYDKEADDIDFVPELDATDFGDIVSDINFIQGGSGGHVIYNMTEDNLSLLVQWANSEESGKSGQNYFNYIKSVKYCPFGFTKKSDDSTVRIAGHLVNVDTTAVKGSIGYRLDTYDSGQFYFTRAYHDFRDFEPYTRICVKIPFADTVQLNPSEWYGYSLRVSYTIDEMTGTGTACIYKMNDSTGENLQFISIPCCIAVDVPLTTLNAGTYHNALIQAKTQRNSALIGVGVGAVNVGANIATANGTGIVLASASLLSSIESAKQADYNLAHMTRPVSSISSASDMSQYRFSYKPNIIITRPAPLPDSFNNGIFTETIGHACVKTGKLSSFKGFTVVSDVNLSGFNATVEEKQMIESALKGGVIL